MKKMIIILSGFLPLSLTSYAEIGKSIEDFKNSKFAKIYSLSLHNQFKVKMFDWLEGYERKEFKGKVVFNFENPTAPSGVSIIASPDGRDILEESILIPHHFFLNEKKEKKLSAIFFILLFLEEATGGRIGTKDIEMLDEMLKEANKHGIGHPVVKKIGRCILGVNLSLIGWEFMVRKAEIGWKFVAGKVENNKKQAEYKSETSKPILNEIAKVYLKNGNVLEGKIAKETERGIYLEILDGKGKIFVRHSEIEKIERSEFSKPSSSSLVCDLERGTLGYLQIGAFTNYKNIIKNLGKPDRVTKELFGTDYKYFNKGIIVVLSSNSKIYEIYIYFQNLQEFDGFYKKFIGRIKQLNEYENILTIKKKFGTPAREIEDIIYKTPELVYKTSYGTLHFCFNNNGELDLIVMREE